MAYGQRKRVYAPRTVSNTRRSSYSRAVSTRRKSTFTKARSKPLTVRANRSMANKNKKAIRKLQSNQWGTYQAVTSTLTQPTVGGFIVLRDHPLLFEVTNPMSGSHGPDLYTTSHQSHGNTARLTYSFQDFQGPGNAHGDYMDSETKHIPNGPMIRLNWVNLQFKFTGVLTDTRITVHILRQKKIVHDFWQQAAVGVNHMFLPETLQSMTNIAGFTPNKIDTKTFEIVASRRVYLNSEASQQSLDGGINYTMEQSTTADTKICRIALKLNKVLKQLHVSEDEPNGEIDLNVAEAPNPLYASKGPYKYTNLHPLAAMWCLISTDDTQTLSDILPDADGVNRGNLKVEVIRRCVWQDRRG